MSKFSHNGGHSLNFAFTHKTLLKIFPSPTFVVLEMDLLRL